MNIDRFLQPSFVRIALDAGAVTFVAIVLLLLMLRGSYNQDAVNVVGNLMAANWFIVFYATIGAVLFMLRSNTPPEFKWLSVAALLFLASLHNPLYPVSVLEAPSMNQMLYIYVATAIILFFTARRRFLKPY